MGPDTATPASLAGFVGLVTAHLPAELAAAEGLAAIRAEIVELPAELASGFGFRCRLDHDGPAAELRLCADAETGGMLMLGGRHPLIALPASIAGSEDWQPIISFCAQREPGFLLHRATESVWVELGAADAGPVLSFNLRHSGLPAVRRAPLDTLVRVLELGCEALHGQPRPGCARVNLRAFVRRLPVGARVVRGGGTSGYRDEARLWIAGLSAADIVALVSSERGADEAARFAAVVDEVGSAASLDLRVDVGDALGPAIAVSCNVDPAGDAAAATERWALLLHPLAQRGLCTPAKRDALLGCRGTLHGGTSPSWPVHLQRVAGILGEETESTISWQPESVEILCDRGEAVAADAYVGVSHGWSPRR